MRHKRRQYEDKTERLDDAALEVWSDAATNQGTVAATRTVRGKNRFSPGVQKD